MDDIKVPEKKLNWFLSMLSEDGKISHKRWLSVSFGIAGVFTIIYVVLKYKEMILDVYHTTLLFILVMSGVATVAQIASIIKGTPVVAQAPEPPEDCDTKDKDKETPTP